MFSHHHRGWYAEFLLKIVLQFLLGKIAARLIFKTMLKSLHIGPGLGELTCSWKSWSSVWPICIWSIHPDTGQGRRGAGWSRTKKSIKYVLDVVYCWSKYTTAGLQNLWPSLNHAWHFCAIESDFQYYSSWEWTIVLLLKLILNLETCKGAPYILIHLTLHPYPAVVAWR